MTTPPTTNGKMAESFQVRRLKNGLTVIVEKNEAVPLVTVDTWVRVGSGDETAEIAGISHFLEHMLFKGTERLPVGEYDRRVEAIGGYLNAGTSMDYTHYYLTAPSEHLDQLLQDMADVMANSTLDAAEYERERFVILEEIRRKQDSPFGFLFDETWRSAIESGPYSDTVIGTAETVSALTRDQLAEHYRRFYAPENMFLIIVGDVDPEETFAKAEEYFGGLERPLEPWRDSTPSTEFSEPATEFWKRDWKEAYFLLWFPGPATRHVKHAALQDLASTLLSGGQSSRLHNSLVEKKRLLSNVGVYIPANRHPSPVLVYGTCEPGKLNEGREAIFQELALLKEKGLRSGELKRIKRQATNGHLYSLETNSGRASNLGYSYALLGNADLVDGYLEAIEKITEEEILDYIGKIMREDKASFHVTCDQPAG